MADDLVPLCPTWHNAGRWFESRAADEGAGSRVRVQGLLSLAINDHEIF
jgi:hypothetical protein